MEPELAGAGRRQQEQEAATLPRGLAQPPTITLRRPSHTCLPADTSPKCSDLATTVEEQEQQEPTALICFCGFYSEKLEDNLGRGRKVTQSLNLLI